MPGLESERGLVAQRRPGRVSDEKMHARARFAAADLQAGDIWADALSCSGVDVLSVGLAEGPLRHWADEALGLATVDIYTQQPARIGLCGRFPQ